MNEVRVVKMEVVDWFVFKGCGIFGFLFSHVFLGGMGGNLFYFIIISKIILVN
jgi:hypothetical protein